MISEIFFLSSLLSISNGIAKRFNCNQILRKIEKCVRMQYKRSNICHETWEEGKGKGRKTDPNSSTDSNDFLVDANERYLQCIANR